MCPETQVILFNILCILQIIIIFQHNLSWEKGDNSINNMGGGGGGGGEKLPKQLFVGFL